MKKALVELSDRWVNESLAKPTPPDECHPLIEHIPNTIREAMMKRFTEDQFGNQVKKPTRV